MAFINGGFETGDLTGWTETLIGTGTAYLVNDHWNGSDYVLPQAGTYFLEIWRDDGTVGSRKSVTQDVALVTGEKIAGYVYFENSADPGHDGAEATIYQGATLISTPWSKVSTASTDWEYFEWTCITSGTYQLRLSVYNTADSFVASYLLADSISILAAPLSDPPGQGTATAEGLGWWSVELSGFDGWINAMTADVTLEGFNGDIQAEGGWSNVIECTLEGFDGDIVALGGAEIVLDGFDGDIISVWSTPEYAYFTLDGFNGDITATIGVPALINVTLSGFDGDIEAYGGAIVILDGFDGDISATAIVPETINSLLDGFDGDVTATIYVPTFINAILDGFDGDLWECQVTLDGFNGDIEAVSVTSVSKSQAFVMNTNTNAVSRWTNYPFEDIVRLGDDYFGVNSNGFYKLEGDLDLTTTISGIILTKDSDAGSFKSKRAQYVYINGDDKVKVTPIVDSVRKTGQYSSFASRKCKLGLGNAGRYHQFEISEIKKLQGIEIIYSELQRRVH